MAIGMTVLNIISSVQSVARFFIYLPKLITVLEAFGSHQNSQVGRAAPARRSPLRYATTYLLAAAFILSPATLQVIADQSHHYDTLRTRAETIWGQHNRTIIYTYDTNGSLTEKKTIVTKVNPEDLVN